MTGWWRTNTISKRIYMLWCSGDTHTKRHSENLPVSASQSPMPLICKSLKSMTNVHMKFGCVPPFTPTSLVHNSIVLCRHRLLWPNCYQLQNVRQMADCNKKKRWIWVLLCFSLVWRKQWDAQKTTGGRLEPNRKRSRSCEMIGLQRECFTEIQNKGVLSRHTNPWGTFLTWTENYCVSIMWRAIKLELYHVFVCVGLNAIYAHMQPFLFLQQPFLLLTLWIKHSALQRVNTASVYTNWGSSATRHKQE